MTLSVMRLRAFETYKMVVLFWWIWEENYKFITLNVIVYIIYLFILFYFILL